MKRTDMQINLEYDSQARAAPQSFRDAIQAAANVLDASFSDNITINISVGYGEINGTPESSGGASAGPSTGVYDSYSQVRSWLSQNAAAEVQSGATALPTGTSIQGQSQVVVWRAQEKLLGQVSASDTGLDGEAGFATDISTNLLEGVALHELTHAMGRVGYSGAQPDIFDLYRFRSAGTYLFGNAEPTAAASYFSLDGGKTDLADYGMTSDPSDFLNSSGRTPNDPFNEFYNAATSQSLSHIDILQMEALGFHAAPTTNAAPSLTISATTGTTNVIDHLITGNIDGADVSDAIQLYDNGQPIGARIFAAANGTFSTTINFATDGAQSITAQATSSFGVTGTSNGLSFNLNSSPNGPLFATINPSMSSPGGEVYALYDGLLGRAPDPTGYSDWKQAIASGAQTVNQVVAQFLSSGEFTTRFGNYTQLSPTQFVTDLYQLTLHRAPDAAGLAGWVGAIQNGSLSREQVAADFAFSAEHVNSIETAFDRSGLEPVTTGADVARLYYGVLGRAPDAAGLGGWDNAISSGSLTLPQVAADLVSSQEFTSTHGVSNDAFVTALYEGALGRAPDAAGEASWVAALSNNTLSRSTVALDIAESPEAMNHTAPQVNAFHLI
jgi:hypothetical protein